jgi:hypothetical protein
MQKMVFFSAFSFELFNFSDRLPHLAAPVGEILKRFQKCTGSHGFGDGSSLAGQGVY